jgi:hypothetical protein
LYASIFYNLIRIFLHKELKFFLYYPLKLLKRDDYDGQVVRERISTATVLLLAYTGQNLRFLHVRRNAVILRRDWPRSPEWSDTFYEWLSAACRSYAATEREVSQLLGHPWTMLTDRQFKLTSVDLRRTQFGAAATVRASFHTYVPPPPLPIAERADNSVPMQKRRQKKSKKANNNFCEQTI